MAEAVTRLYGIAPEDPVLAAIPVAVPPQRAMGDVAVPLAFELARRLRKAPRVIAQELAGALGSIEGFSRIEATPNGYVNLFLDRPAFALRWLRQEGGRRRRRARQGDRRAHRDQPNKAAHIGHLRNAALGDTLRARAALPRRAGRDPELHRRHRRPGRRRRRRVPRARAQDPRRGPRHRRHHALRLLLLGPLCPRHRVVRRGQGAPGDPRRGPARDRARRTTTSPRMGAFHRRPHRPRPPARRWRG